MPTPMTRRPTKRASSTNSHEPNGFDAARKYQSADGPQWIYPQAPGPNDPRSGHTPNRGRAGRGAFWAFAIAAALMLVVAVTWMGITMWQAPTGTVAERQALEEVRTPPDAAPAGEPEPGNRILVPEYALWAPGTKIQTTDHYPQPGESFTAQACTVAFSFSDTSGRNFAVTASHCGNVGDLVWPTNAEYATDYQVEAGRFIYSGLFAEGGDGVDVGIIEITDPQRFMEVIGAPIPTGIGEEIPELGRVCKTGSTTGYTCGPFLETQRVQIIDTDVDIPRSTYGDIAEVCVSPGDSGGPVFSEVNGRAVIIGVVSGTEAGRSEEECFEGMENPKRMSYSNVEQVMNAIHAIVPDPAWVTQSW